MKKTPSKYNFVFFFAAHIGFNQYCELSLLHYDEKNLQGYKDTDMCMHKETKKHTIIFHTYCE